ncbi:MAG: hypothetical protein ACJ779_07520, partial [Chloroflexota bacterium]
PIVIHGWPEDPDWIGRVSATLKDSLPDLEDAIGLPWPVTHDLDVTEVAASEIEGYAGFFDSSYDRITISEELDDLTTVHEASHAWFGGGLFQERWIDEGLADEYASRVLAADHPGRPKDGPDPVSITDKAAFDLNTWRPPGRIDEESAAYEQFGYDASWKVVRAIVDDVGETRMRDVFKAAAARTVTYVGSGPAETSGFVPDWRRFLDLVTDVGGSKKAEDLLETWVLTPKQDAELTARDAARATYVDLVRDGGDWLPGIVVRKPMSEWRFEGAKTAMTAATKVLAARDALSAATTELGLSFPAGLEAAYESASTTDDLAKLETTIDGWSEAASSIRTARDGLAAERSPLVQLGLLGADPAAGYRSAVAAFEAGDRGAVTTGTAATIAALADAEDIGRGRATMVGVAVVIAITVVVLLAAFIVTRRRRRQAAFAVAPAAAPPPADDAVPPPPIGIRRLDDPRDPYATLAATSDLVEEAGVGAPGARGAEPD